MKLPHRRRAPAFPLLDAIRWLPALTAVAYLATVAMMSDGLIRALYWDSDASSPLMLAERLRGQGPVYVPHFGSWTSLWWMLATRHLPGHVQLWEATGYPFAVAGATLLGFATARVAGKWAGLTAATTALIVGPLAFRSFLTLTYHVSPPFTAAVLAAYLVLLTRSRSRALAAGVGLLAGVNAASDPLLWVAGIAPFAIAAAVLTATVRRLDVAMRATITLAVAVISAVAAGQLMHSLGYKIGGIAFRPAHLGDLPGNVLHLGRMVALLGGANYALPGGYPVEPLRLVLALFACGAVAAAVVAAFKQLLLRAEPTVRAYACYWGAAAALLGIAFVGTTNAADLGAGSVNYLLTLALAGGAGIALLSAGSRRAQLVVALVVTAVGAVNIAGIVTGRAGTPKGAIGTYERQLVDLLEKKGVTRGYAGYWDAHNLAWQSGKQLIVTPVSQCGPALCASTFFTIHSWFDERPEPSFLIVDPTTAFVTQPPAVVRDAAASYRFGPLTVYLFSYDLARHIQPPQT